jgi:hypothetical protein
MMLIEGKFKLLSTTMDAVALLDCPRKFFRVSEMWYVASTTKS